MLDIQFIRDNSKLVSQKSAQKGYPVDIEKLLAVDKKRRDLLTQVETLRRKRNDLVTKTKGTKPDEEQMAIGRKIKDDLLKIEASLKKIEEDYFLQLKAVPNMPMEDVPVGHSEDENIVVKEVGEKPKFEFKPKTHYEIGEKEQWIDKQRAAKVSGSRFTYLQGPIVELQFALIQWTIRCLSSREILIKIIKESGLSISDAPFIPVIPPVMIKTSVFNAMDRLEPRDDRYKVGDESDDLWLEGSAEHVLGPMYMNEIMDVKNLPVRLLGYASSFRREAGSYGKDTEGIIRMHQFDKLEMEVFSTSASGIEEHQLLIAIQEYLVQQLKLPYRLVNKCTFDIGKPNAHGVDIEVWMPGQNRYLETHTADYMTDYQSRRLQTRVRSADGEINFVHTNDGTALALGRIMAAIIENYQDKDGKVGVPEVLKTFINDRGVL